MRLSVNAIGDIFVAPKTADRQREVWNGSLISQAAWRPPPPAMLANPACFVDIAVLPGEQLFFSKRDMHTCYDIIQAPASIKPWFGRPPVLLSELMQASGWNKSPLLALIDGVHTKKCF